MKRGFALVALGLVAIAIQGGLATALPAPFCPDLGLLVVLGLGLVWRGARSGLLVAALLGYIADLLSGAPLGHNGLLRPLSFAAARLGSRQLNLRRGLPMAVFAASLSLTYVWVGVALSHYFTGAAPLAAADLWRGIVHAAVNGACAPPVVALTALVSTRLGPESEVRRPLRLGPRESAL